MDLPKDAALYGDKGYNDAASERFLLDDGGVRLVPIRKKNMQRMIGRMSMTCACTAKASRRSIANSKVWAWNG